MYGKGSGDGWIARGTYILYMPLPLILVGLLSNNLICSAFERLWLLFNFSTRAWMCGAGLCPFFRDFTSLHRSIYLINPLDRRTKSGPCACSRPSRICPPLRLPITLPMRSIRARMLSGSALSVRNSDIAWKVLATRRKRGSGGPRRETRDIAENPYKQVTADCFFPAPADCEAFRQCWGETALSRSSRGSTSTTSVSNACCVLITSVSVCLAIVVSLHLSPSVSSCLSLFVLFVSV